MIYVIGDIHGSAEKLEHIVETIENDRGRALDTDDMIICAGDVGIRYGAHRSHLLERAMRSHPCTFAIVRGNHDARYCRDLLAETTATRKRSSSSRSRNASSGWLRPYGGLMGKASCEGDEESDWLSHMGELLAEAERATAAYASEIEWNGGKAVVDAKSPNIVYLADEGGIYDLDGKKTLVIPGAYSVDRFWRLSNPRVPFEPDEMLAASEMNRIIDLAAEAKPQRVVSHTAPLRWEDEISVLFLKGVVQSTIDKSMEKMMDAVLDAAGGSIERWWFGHFHGDMEVGGGVGRMLFNRYSEFS